MEGFRVMNPAKRVYPKSSIEETPSWNEEVSWFWSVSQVTALTHSHLRQTQEKQRHAEFQSEQRPLNVTLLKDSDEEEMEETVGHTVWMIQTVRPMNWTNKGS